MPDRPRKYPASLLPAVIILLLLVSLFGACNSSQTPAGGQEEPPIPLASPPLQPISHGQAKECGVVATFGTADVVPTQNIYLTSQSGRCFWQAVQQCQPAALIYIDNIGVTRVFLVARSSRQCVLTDIVQQSQNQTKRVFTCARADASEGYLLFTACGGDGDIAVPFP